MLAVAISTWGHSLFVYGILFLFFIDAAPMSKIVLCPLHTPMSTFFPVQSLIQELEGVLNEKEQVVMALQREVLL